MTASRAAYAHIDTHCLCLGLQRAAREAARRFDEALAPLELSNGQFSMLSTVAGLQSVSIGTLATRLAMDRTTVTAALKPLVRRRLVEVAVGATDARSRDVTLTRAGKALLDRAIPLWKSVQDGLSKKVGATEVPDLHRHLRNLR